MAHNKAYREAEKKIKKARRSGATKLDLSAKDDEKLTELPESLGQLTQLQELNLSNNQLTALPESLGQLTQLQELNLRRNQLTALPKWLGQLTQLRELNLSGNKLTALPETLVRLSQLQNLNLCANKLTTLPEWFSNLSALNDLALGDSSGGNPFKEFPLILRNLKQLKVLWLGDCNLNVVPGWLGELADLDELNLYKNRITDIPVSIEQLPLSIRLGLDNNPLNPELAVAYEQGLDAVKVYLRAKTAEQITLNEAKLILIGEGDVGKTCLMDALQGAPWQEHDTTHGIEIRSVQAVDPESGTEITLNGWDFGGQRVYRPTHQLFFSSPAVYLVVWKPREGPQQGFVEDWIKLVKHREPDSKILVVATHGGPQQRQPDIDRQELWDLFGKDRVLDFFHVESKPDENGERRGIEELKQAIARVAAGLPEMRRKVPKRWQDVREALAETESAYRPLRDVFELCRDHKMDEEEARLFVTISHRLGHLIHYEHDPGLRDIVVLKPDWLATAISLALDDEATRKSHGLIPRVADHDS